MKTLELFRSVRIEGSPLFGPYKAWVDIFPSKTRFWTYRREVRAVRRLIRVDANSVDAKGQNLALSYLSRGSRRSTGHVMEHLLPLKIAGLLAVELESTHCLPYFGSALPFFEQVLSYATSHFVDIEVRTVARRVSFRRSIGDREVFLDINPRHDEKLRLDIRIDYPGLGKWNKVYVFPDDELLLKIASVGAQGWPLSRYQFSRFSGSLGLWRHHDKIVWPQECSKEEALEKFADHRCLDLLGALALLMNGNWFSGNVTSVCAGHVDDIEVCRMASRQLVLVD